MIRVMCQNDPAGTHVEDGVDHRQVKRHERDDRFLEQQDPRHSQSLPKDLPRLCRSASIPTGEVDLPGDLGQPFSSLT